jgi:hypothetical protein
VEEKNYWDVGVAVFVFQEAAGGGEQVTRLRLVGRVGVLPPETNFGEQCYRQGPEKNKVRTHNIFQLD